MFRLVWSVSMSTNERWLHFVFYKLSCLSHVIVVTKVVFQASINYLLCEIDFMFYILIRISSMTLFEGWTFKESFQHLIPLKCLSIKLSKMSACWQFWLSCLQEHENIFFIFSSNLAGVYPFVLTLQEKLLTYKPVAIAAWSQRERGININR